MLFSPAVISDSCCTAVAHIANSSNLKGVAVMLKVTMFPLLARKGKSLQGKTAPVPLEVIWI